MREVKFYKGKDHFEDAYFVREQVFMIEQGFSSEIDEIDETCTHCVIYEDGKPVACGRFYTEKENQCTIGRIAVLKEYRQQKLGNVVMENIIHEATSMGYRHFVLSSQCQAQGFYEKLGFVASGEEYLDEHCPHIHMEKRI